MGLTGQGKSLLLNRLAGEMVFESDDVCECTRDSQSVDFRMMGGPTPHYLSLIDTAGLGEPVDRSPDYYEKYEKEAARAHVILYVVRANRRDFAADLALVQRLKQAAPDASFLLVINAIDAISPINHQDTEQLSPKQLENLQDRVVQLSRLFSVSPDKIFTTCARTGAGIEALATGIRQSLMTRVQVRRPIIIGAPAATRESRLERFRRWQWLNRASR